MSKKHIIILLLCCLIPVVAIGLILLFRLSVNQVLLLALVLLCPLSHLLMMRFLPHDENHHQGQIHEHHSAGSTFQEVSTGKRLKDEA